MKLANMHLFISMLLHISVSSGLRTMLLFMSDYDSLCHLGLPYVLSKNLLLCPLYSLPLPLYPPLSPYTCSPSPYTHPSPLIPAPPPSPYTLLPLPLYLLPLPLYPLPPPFIPTRLPLYPLPPGHISALSQQLRKCTTY